MITADTITCRIPTEYAVKIEKLFCAVANPVDSANSQTWAAWASVVVTAFAVFFAIKAWNTARQANAIAEKNLTQAERALNKQLAETRRGIDQQITSALQLSNQEQERERMLTYLEALFRLVHSAAIFEKRADGQTQFNHDKGELTILWSAWSAYYMVDDPEFREATAAMNTMYVNSAQALQEVARKISENDFPGMTIEAIKSECEAASNHQDKLFAAVGRYVALVQAMAFKVSGYEIMRDEIIADARTAKANNQSQY